MVQTKLRALIAAAGAATVAVMLAGGFAHAQPSSPVVGAMRGSTVIGGDMFKHALSTLASAMFSVPTV
jgi:hypothetical protein